MCTFVEKVVCLKPYLRAGVLKMLVLHFGEERVGSPHSDIIKKLKSLLKSYEKVFINARSIFWDKPKLLE